MCRCLLAVTLLVSFGQAAEPEITEAELLAAIDKAIRFHDSEVARHGGYVWVTTADMKHRMGEAVTDENTIWIQPPGTAGIGIAFAEAYAQTQNPEHLAAAVRTANALVQTQLHSGGWYYGASFDPAERKKKAYRKPPHAEPPKLTREEQEVSGWFVWRKRRNKHNQSIIDDDTTAAALRCLIKVDAALDFENNEIHEAATYGLNCLLRVQYPNGAFSHNYDSVSKSGPDHETYPLKQASIPTNWSRTWTKDFTGAYVINDRITSDAVRTLLLAAETYRDFRYLTAAKKGGEFFRLAQLPEPHAGWAQQYNVDMHPVWDRAFEPPALTGMESQSVIDVLLDIYAATEDEKYLEPVPKALAWLKASELPEGNLARFYELGTNKPLYFTKKYQLTTDRTATPDHYAFVCDSKREQLTRRYERLRAGKPESGPNAKWLANHAAEVRQVLDALDDRGRWTEPGFSRNLEGRKVSSPDGILRSDTFIKNLALLVDALQAVRSR